MTQSEVSKNDPNDPGTIKVLRYPGKWYYKSCMHYRGLFPGWDGFLPSTSSMMKSTVIIQNGIKRGGGRTAPLYSLRPSVIINCGEWERRSRAVVYYTERRRGCLRKLWRAPVSRDREREREEGGVVQKNDIYILNIYPLASLLIWDKLRKGRIRTDNITNAVDIDPTKEAVMLRSSLSYFKSFTLPRGNILRKNQEQ